MAAISTLSHENTACKSPISKVGVLTLHGFGVRIRVQSGHLEIEDGVGMQRRKIRLARVGHGLKRLVCISEDGFVSLSALKWLAEVGSSFVMLNRMGKVLFVTGPTAPSEARMRRAQALALENGVGLEISRSLINAKLEGQERVVRERLNDSSTAAAIAALRERIATADNVEAVRMLEAHAAVSYFGSWRNIPVLWPKADLPRVADHWRTVGSRQSPLSGGPRLAVTPVHAILNYCFALLESESRLALAALGLDPGLGLGLHTDIANRDSLALDLLEPIRPQVEDWVLSWIMREPLRRADFFEAATGNCRLRSHFTAELSETAPIWRKLVGPWAEYVAQELWDTVSRSRTARQYPTPLTQQHRSEGRGKIHIPNAPPAPKVQRICRTCGVSLRRGQSHCASCASAEAKNRMLQIAPLGRVATHSLRAEALRAASQRRQRAALRAWRSSDNPSWLTEGVYRKSIQPALRDLTVPAIATALGVSLPYATQVRAGRCRPHPRHWEVLAELVGI